MGLAALVRRRSPATVPLFGAEGELYPVWAEAALLGWAAVQAAAAVRPSATGAQRVALARALLVPGGLAIAAARSEHRRRRGMYAAAATGNTLAAVASVLLGRRLR